MPIKTLRQPRYADEVPRRLIYSEFLLLLISYSLESRRHRAFGLSIDTFFASPYGKRFRVNTLTWFWNTSFQLRFHRMLVYATQCELYKWEILIWKKKLFNEQRASAKTSCLRIELLWNNRCRRCEQTKMRMFGTWSIIYRSSTTYRSAMKTTMTW